MESRKVRRRKRDLLGDTPGLMMRIEVHSAAVQDRDDAALLFDRIAARFPFVKRFFADAGYQGPRVVAAAPRPVEIVRRSDPGFVVQAKRQIVERTSACITINRRLAKEFERLAATVQTKIQIAMIKLMSRRIARYKTSRGGLGVTFAASMRKLAGARGPRAFTSFCAPAVEAWGATLSRA